MSWAFFILAFVTTIGAIGAMFLRHPVHCALSLTLTFLGLAGLFLTLNAQFIGLVQVLVYVGAVAVLIVFAILLTQGGDATPGVPTFSPFAWLGMFIAAVFFVVLATAVAPRHQFKAEIPSAPVLTVRDVGDSLLGEFVLPLEALGLLLTAALIGATLIAMDEKPRE